jgi:hypothetical protein
MRYRPPRNPPVYPRFDKALDPYRRWLPHATEKRWRAGRFPHILRWMIERPETLFALYQDAIEQQKEAA